MPTRSCLSFLHAAAVLPARPQACEYLFPLPIAVLPIAPVQSSLTVRSTIAVPPSKAEVRQSYRPRETTSEPPVTARRHDSLITRRPITGSPSRNCPSSSCPSPQNRLPAHNQRRTSGPPRSAYDEAQPETTGPVARRNHRVSTAGRHAVPMSLRHDFSATPAVHSVKRLRRAAATTRMRRSSPLRRLELLIGAKST